MVGVGVLDPERQNQQIVHLDVVGHRPAHRGRVEERTGGRFHLQGLAEWNFEARHRYLGDVRAIGVEVGKDVGRQHRASVQDGLAFRLGDGAVVRFPGSCDLRGAGDAMQGEYQQQRPSHRLRGNCVTHRKILHGKASTSVRFHFNQRDGFSRGQSGRDKCNRVFTHLLM
jgi:hypothetical protein